MLNKVKKNERVLAIEVLPAPTEFTDLFEDLETFLKHSECDNDPFALPEEDLFLVDISKEEIEEEMSEFFDFFQIIFVPLFALLTGNKVCFGYALASSCLSSPKQLEEFINIIPPIGRIIKSPTVNATLKRINWIFPFLSSILGNSISNPMDPNIDDPFGYRKNDPNLDINHSFNAHELLNDCFNFLPNGLLERSELKSELKSRGRMPPGYEAAGHIVVQKLIEQIEEELKDPSLSSEKRTQLEKLLKVLKWYRTWILPLWLVKKIGDFRTPYPYLTVSFFLLLYILYRNRKVLFLLVNKFSTSISQTYLEMFGKQAIKVIENSSKQIALVPGKQVAIPLSATQKQIMRILTDLEKQVQIVLFILEKQVALIADKNKQLALVLDIFAKQLELIPDRNKQVALVLTALAKQLVLRSNPNDLEILLGTELVVYKPKPVLPPLLILGELALRIINDTPFNGEDHF
jgi:hypothetical protein